MLMAMEEAFDLEIPDADAEKIETVQQCVDLMCKHTTGSGLTTEVMGICLVMLLVRLGQVC